MTIMIAITLQCKLDGQTCTLPPGDLRYVLPYPDEEIRIRVMPDLQNAGLGAPRVVAYAAKQVLGRTINEDELGFLHDRDVLAVYGDPKWNARLQQPLGKPAGYKVKFIRKGKKAELVISTNQYLDSALMKGKDTLPVRTAVPFSFFFTERLNAPKLTAGQDWKVALDENFIQVYDGFERGKTYRIKIETK